jgi:flagellin-like protein
MLPGSRLTESISMFDSADNRGISPMISAIVLIAIVVLVGAALAAFSMGMFDGMERAPQANFQVTDATDGSTDEVLIQHGGGAEINAQDTIIKIKRDGATLVTLDEGNDVDVSVGDTVNVSSDGSSTTVNFAGNTAFSNSDNGFDLNNGEVKIIIIDSGSDQPITTVTGDA